MSVSQVSVTRTGFVSARPGTPRTRINGQLRLVRPTSWALWERPKRAIGYVIGIDLAAIVVVAGGLLRPVELADLRWLGILLACVVLYTEASRPIERIREHYAGGPHVDLNSVWMFAAVLLLHPTLAAAVIATSYTYRWLRVRHHVVHRQAFSAAATMLSGAASSQILTGVGGATFGALDRDATTFLLVAATALLFIVINGVLIAVAVLLAAPSPPLRSLMITPSEYALEGATLALAILLAWALVDWPVALALIVGITLVMHRNVLIRQLRDNARTDSKTGLLNAAGWSTEADGELSRATRTATPTSLLVIDLDYFKAFNDAYGHLAGDEILRAVADTISAEVRSYDIVGRFGGEEFVVLLPGTSGAETAHVAERIRCRVASLTLPTTDARLTVSIGVAVVPEHASTLNELLHSADMAMYAAKAAGRNRVALADQVTNGTGDGTGSANGTVTANGTSPVPSQMLPTYPTLPASRTAGNGHPGPTV